MSIKQLNLVIDFLKTKSKDWCPKDNFIHDPFTLWPFDPFSFLIIISLNVNVYYPLSFSYVNHWSDDLSSNMKISADALLISSILTIVYDKSISANILKYDLDKISNWSFQLEEGFNPDTSKHTLEVMI